MGEMWTDLADARETALARRGIKAEAQWSEHTRALAPLQVGDSVLIQNQLGNHPLRWDKRGTVMKCEGNDQYMVMVDGSRRITRRNRKFLRQFTPFKPPGQQPAVQQQEQVQQQPSRDQQQPAVQQQARVQQQQQHEHREQLPVQQQVQQNQVPRSYASVTAGPDMQEKHQGWNYKPYHHVRHKEQWVIC